MAFQGSVFIGGYQGVYRLTGDALLRVTELGDEAFHCVALSACDTELLLVTERWFAVFDGVQWQRHALRGSDLLVPHRLAPGAWVNWIRRLFGL